MSFIVFTIQNRRTDGTEPNRKKFKPILFSIHGGEEVCEISDKNSINTPSNNESACLNFNIFSAPGLNCDMPAPGGFSLETPTSNYLNLELLTSSGFSLEPTSSSCLNLKPPFSTGLDCSTHTVSELIAAGQAFVDQSLSAITFQVRRLIRIKNCPFLTLLCRHS